MHEHRLASPSSKSVTCRHMRRDILRRDGDHRGDILAGRFAPCEIVDDRNMVGAEIGEQMRNADFEQRIRQRCRGRARINRHDGYRFAGRDQRSIRRRALSRGWGRE